MEIYIVGKEAVISALESIAFAILLLAIVQMAHIFKRK